jgi:TRAP-type mannitol/chloroaromatic compound transport system permease small subunit
MALVVLIGLDVGGRNMFDQPLSGVPEIVGLSIIVIVFLQAPQALQLGRITRSDTLLNLLKLKSEFAGRMVETFFDLLGMFVFAVIIYGTWPMLQKAWTRSEFVGAVGDFTAPVWPVRTAVIIGSVLLLVNFSVLIINRWKRPHHDTI